MGERSEANRSHSKPIRTLGGTLRGEAPDAQQASDLPQIQTFPGLFRDEVTHRLARPQCEREFELFGSLVGNEMANLQLLGRIDLGAPRLTPPSGTCQRLEATLPVLAKPSTNRAAMHFEHVCDFLLGVPPFAQSDGLLADFLLCGGFEFSGIAAFHLWNNPALSDILSSYCAGK